jgi:hypothetical protein
MSSYSEYLGRQQQRMQKVLDTRPHRDAGHQTEIVRRLAASGTQEQRSPATACVQTLNAPSTRSPSTFSIAKGHTVQDTTRYSEYTAGQAVAQSSMPVNAKASQISVTCYSSTVVPELNNRLAADAQLSLIQAAKNTYQRGWNTAACCQVCGKPPAFKGGCACALTASQQAGFPTSVSRPEVPS